MKHLAFKDYHRCEEFGDTVIWIALCSSQVRSTTPGVWEKPFAWQLSKFRPESNGQS